MNFGMEIYDTIFTIRLFAIQLLCTLELLCQINIETA